MCSNFIERMSGIYIHIPFCKQKCYYCDFHFSVSLRNKDPMLSAILKEIELRKNEVKTKVETIYFGGGTPSILSVDEIKGLLNALYSNFTISKNAEITLEANPDDLNLNKLKEISQTKINRLSIGVQSFFDDDLKYMNRSHNANEAKNCINHALKYFKNISIDLIYGIPETNTEKWKKNLQIAFAFDVPHLSAYALTVENNTALDNFIRKGKFKPLDDSLALKHFNILMKEAKKNGFEQYEISNFGKKNYYSKHNTAYWTGNTYLGIGPSSHSFDGVCRSWNVANNARYIKALQQGKLPNEKELLTKNDNFNEFIMTNLRTVWGVSVETIEKKYGTQFKNLLLKNSLKHIENKTLIWKDKHLKITSKGKFLCDGIASDLFVIEND